MRFHLTADAQFEAHDLNDALGQLTQHFADMMGGQPDGESLDFEGSIRVGAARFPGAPTGRIGPPSVVEERWHRRLLAAVGWRA